MVAEAEQHQFAAGKFFGLINRVAITLLLRLHGKGHASGKFSHLLRLAQQRGMLLQPFQVIAVRSAQVGAHHFVLAGLDDDADFLDACRVEFEQVIMEQRAGNSVGPDHRKHFLFHRVRRREMPCAKSGDRNDGFADG